MIDINFNSLQINDRMFFGSEEVVVLKTYAHFHLVKVKYSSSSTTFMVDMCALQSHPDAGSAISISMLGEVP
ncbi:hypothetical protein ACFSR7_12675 [Cohnella sp. GCM10020058]|uniref:hypothetical protein n=1 Tax=Cohnella sp. GCM10020058 TaxID=3317330 RepID=UPI00364393E1